MMKFPMAIAHYIAKACELPFLFVGKSSDLGINYIWSICHEDAWTYPHYSTFVIGSNKWIWGLNYYWGNHKSSQVVDLSEEDDNIFKLLKQYKEFPSNENVLDGSTLNLILFEKNEHRIELIHYSDAEESIELEASFERLHRIIHDKAEHHQNVVAPAITINKYTGDFLRFTEFTKIFGLSTSFEASSELLPFDYILHVTLNYDPQFVFVKTPSGFYGTRFRSHHKGEVIMSLPDNSTDWKQLINEPQIEGERGVGTIIKVVLYLKNETLGTSLKKPTKPEEVSALWRALNPLMERLNKE